MKKGKGKKGNTSTCERWKGNKGGDRLKRKEREKMNRKQRSIGKGKWKEEKRIRGEQRDEKDKEGGQSR